MDSKLKKFIIDILRKATFKWKPRTTAKNRRKEKVGEFSTGRSKYEYRCEGCQKLFKSKDVVLDHIDPVVPIDGYKSGLEFDLNEYAVRMFCEADGLQVLCAECHDKKTKDENNIRRSKKSLAK